VIADALLLGCSCAERAAAAGGQPCCGSSCCRWVATVLLEQLKQGAARLLEQLLRRDCRRAAAGVQLCREGSCRWRAAMMLEQRLVVQRWAAQMCAALE
jgi:hypothetical protein